MAVDMVTMMLPMIYKILKPMVLEMLEEPGARKKIATLLNGGESISISSTPELIANTIIQMSGGDESKQEAIEKLAEKTTPVKRDSANAPSLKSSDRRFALARTFINGEPGVSIITETDTGPAYAAAIEFSSKLSERVEVLVTGEAFSGQRKLARIDPPHVSGIAPGSSICQHNGWAGTLGAFVKISPRDGAGVPCFTSASHVLELRDKDKRGVFCPGRPDAEPLMRNEIAEVIDYVGLSSFQNLDDPDAILNTCDIGAARLLADADRYQTMVRNPEGGNPLWVRRELDGDEITDRLAGGPVEVFMMGRTTKFGRGILRSVDSTPVPIKIGSQKYLYSELGFVVPSDGVTVFSEPGDSGALVYTKDGRAVGFVVGGTGKGVTLIHMAHSCLERLGAALL